MGQRRRRGPPAPYERDIQAAVVEHWRLLGLPKTLVAAMPNAGALGQPGLTCCLGNLLVLAPSLPGSVCFIELKRDKSSPRSDRQRAFCELCDYLGIPYALCVGRDQPIRVLEDWGVVRRAAA